MKLALALMSTAADQKFLNLHLPVWWGSDVFDGVVVLDDGTSDMSLYEMVEDLCGRRGDVTWIPFQNFGDQGNQLIDRCEALDYSHLVRMDGDELMFPSALANVAHYLESFKGVYLPRIHFVKDRAHYSRQWMNPNPKLPDAQFRAWQLNLGLRYHMPVHEVPDYHQLGWKVGDANQPCDIVRAYGDMIFHYGWTRPLEERSIREYNNRAIAAGKETVRMIDDVVPPRPPGTTFADFEILTEYPEHVPYEPLSRQPLDPLEVGIHAPY